LHFQAIKVTDRFGALGLQLRSPLLGVTLHHHFEVALQGREISRNHMPDRIRQHAERGRLAKKYLLAGITGVIAGGSKAFPFHPVRQQSPDFPFWEFKLFFKSTLRQGPHGSARFHRFSQPR
jgi:hypothetical protein